MYLIDALQLTLNKQNNEQAGCQTDQQRDRHMHLRRKTSKYLLAYEQWRTTVRIHIVDHLLRSYLAKGKTYASLA